MDIFSLLDRFMTLFMNNEYFHLKNVYFHFAPQVPLPKMQLKPYRSIARYRV